MSRSIFERVDKLEKEKKNHNSEKVKTKLSLNNEKWNMKREEDLQIKGVRPRDGQTKESRR